MGLVKITQVLQEADGEFRFAQNFGLDVVVERGPELLFGPDKAGITALRWVDIVGRGVSPALVRAPDLLLILHIQPILLVCKPGIVHLWTIAGEEFGWTGSRSLLIKTQKISTIASALHQVSGIIYLRLRDILVLTLSDGSFHTIHNLSKDPSWTSQKEDDQIASNNLSKTSRSVFVKAEQGAVDRNDMNRITGAISYDDHATFLWAYE